MHSVCRCSLPVWRRSFLKKGTPLTYFWPRPGSAPGRIWQKNNNTCKGPWVLHPYQVSSKSIKWFWRRSRKCESLRTDDGRCAVTIAHSSLPLRWAKKCTSILNTYTVIRGYYVSVLQKLTGYRRIPCQEWVSPRGVSRVVKRTFLTGDSPIPCQFL